MRAHRNIEWIIKNHCDLICPPSMWKRLFLIQLQLEKIVLLHVTWRTKLIITKYAPFLSPEWYSCFTSTVCMSAWQGCDSLITSLSSEAIHRCLQGLACFYSVRNWPWTLPSAGKVTIPFPVETSYPFASKMSFEEQGEKVFLKSPESIRLAFTNIVA